MEHNGASSISGLAHLRIFDAWKLDFSLTTGRNDVLAGNRAQAHYQSLTNTLYEVREHMMKLNATLGKNGPILHPDDFFAYQFSQMTVSQEIFPFFRAPTPALPIRSGLPYNEEEAPEIMPKFRKDVKEGRIFSRRELI